MPRSTNYFKKETLEFILKNYDRNINILDVGPGIGTYSNLLSPHGYTNIDCIEVFEPYIEDYGLKNKYRQVIIGDISEIEINFLEYDLIIFGDVFEHISEENCKKIISRIEHSDIIIAIPFDSPQGEHFGNVYETHLQPNLNFINFSENYTTFYPISIRFDYGVFINRKLNKIYIEDDEKPLPNDFYKFIENKFPRLKLINLNESKNQETVVNKSTTIVTCLWDMGRGDINDSFKRGYDTYLEKFAKLLETDIPMYIFIDPKDEEFVWKYRNKSNTVINTMTLDELKTWFNFTNKTNHIRNQEEWLNQASWLRNSPQAVLDAYNPVVMSKMFMLNNVTIWNPFNSEYFFWIDGGITSTVHYGYFTHNKVFDKLPTFIDKNNEFVFLTYPYEGGNEVHGFERAKLASYCNTDYVKFVCRGGFFGGKKERINQINGLYYHYLNSSLSEGLMGTEESVFTILMYNHKELITQFMIEQDGLVWRFFEDLKDDKFTDRVVKENPIKRKGEDINSVALYVITFNSPTQFETLIKSMLEYDENFIKKTKKFLLDNSSDETTFDDYKKLCEQFDFEHIKKDNLGICGGRQWIAEHFDETNLNYYLFFEDDMFFYPNGGEVCRNGFNRFVENFYQNSLEIIQKENFDFLKFNYSEFFGDNGVQWSWYNVPQNVRQEYWPEKPNLPVQGLDPNAPKTVYRNILSHKGIPYANGEVYYSNWPQIVSREGNKKMFLDTTWARPFEQTWMSHMYQLTKKGELNPGILLMTPTEHNRFEHYDGKLRKES